MARLGSRGAGTSATYYAAVTPHDSTNFVDGVCDALFVGGTGVVRAVREDDTVVSFTVPAGTRLDIVAKRVNSTSTTATGIVALYY